MSSDNQGSETTESDGSPSFDSGPGRREVAYRLFAAEFDDATLSYAEGDEERAPNYVVTPTGARVNRVFAVGVLTEVETVNENTCRGRIVDPSGAFITYAGQYQPDAMAFLERADPPDFVALTGKARTFQPDDSDRVYTSVRPESLSTVDANVRDRWVVTTAESTLDRLAIFVRALDSDLRGDQLQTALHAGGASPALAAGIPKALETYNTTPGYVEAIRRMAVESLELVSGDRDAVTRPEFAPDERGPDQVETVEDVGPLPPTDVTVDETAVPESSETGDDESPVIDEAESGTVEKATGSTENFEETEQAEGVEETEPSEDNEKTEPAEDVEETAQAAGVEETDPTANVEDAGMYELDEAERQEVEAEYGTEFTTGTEVDEPGESDIDVPDADELAAELEAEGDSDSQNAADESGASEPDSSESDSDEETTDADSLDLESAVIEAIEALDDGDGADRSEVITSVVDTYSVDPDAAEDAIQDALMSGLCYEPGENRLKAI